MTATCVVEVLPNPDAGLRGDANNDGLLDVQDLVSVIDFLVNGIPCKSMINANVDGRFGVDLTNLQMILQLVLKAAP